MQLLWNWALRTAHSKTLKQTPVYSKIFYSVSSTVIQLLYALHDRYLSYFTCSALSAFTFMASPFSFCSCPLFLSPSFSVLSLPNPTYLSILITVRMTYTNAAQHSLLANPVFSCMQICQKTCQLKFSTLRCLPKVIFFFSWKWQLTELSCFQKWSWGK